MAKKYINIDEAAALLRISPKELGEIRAAGEIRGFADRGTWKFKQEDIEELMRTRQGSDADVPIFNEDDFLSELAGNADDANNVVLGDEDELGAQPTEIRKGDGSDIDPGSDSDVRLLPNDSSVPIISNESEIDDIAVNDIDSDSDVRLISESIIGSDTGNQAMNLADTVDDLDSGLIDAPLDDEDSDSDVQLLDDSSAQVVDDDSDVRLADDSDTLHDDQGSALVLDDDSGLGSLDSDIRLASESGPIDVGSDSDVRLVDALRDAPTGSDSDVTLLPKGDSGSQLPHDESGVAVDLDPMSGHDASVLFSDESGLTVDDSGVSLSSESGILASESGISLDRLDDSGISLANEDSGLTLDGEDSGLTLDAPDSGLTLEMDSSDQQFDHIPLDDESGIALDTADDSGIALDIDHSDSDNNFNRTIPMLDAQGGEDEEDYFATAELPESSLDDDSEVQFELQSGLDDDDDDDLETAVIMFDDEEDADDYTATVVRKNIEEDNEEEAELEAPEFDEEFVEADDYEEADFDVDMDMEFEEEDVMGVGDEAFDVDSSYAAGPVTQIVAPKEYPWDPLTLVGLCLSAVTLSACGIVMFDLIRSMWRFQDPTTYSGMILEQIRGLF